MKIDKELLSALKLAAERITAYHTAQKKTLLRDSKNKNLGWLMRPLERVGVYVPGFQAPLPSTLLMTAIPAKVAGVKEIILVTPPGKQGSVSPVTLAAAAIAGIDRVFSVGGAQAIAALAYGTESVPRVDKVCGPGNIYVSLAKKMVYRRRSASMDFTGRVRSLLLPMIRPIRHTAPPTCWPRPSMAPGLRLS